LTAAQSVSPFLVGDYMNLKDTTLRIEYISIGKLTPNKKNARAHHADDIQCIKNSIEQFGMCDPIGVWGDDNIIVEGQGRLQALKELGYTEVPTIRLDFLSDEERRAYGIAHNKTAENSSWDFENLNAEMSDLSVDFDFSNFGFISSDDGDDDYKEITDEKPNERIRTVNSYNLQLYDEERAVGKYQMPLIDKSQIIPNELIGFNYMKSTQDHNVGIHCFIDDYQFERLWNSPQLYIDDILKFDCILTPDFSLYMDMPLAMKIWNVYRSRLLGQFWQDCGMEVIPTVQWAEPATYEFCFDGIPQNSVVAVSTIGVKKGESLAIWNDGMHEMIKRLKPQTILVYGGKLDFDYGSIDVRYFDNQVTERMKLHKKSSCKQSQNDL
jgi:hypothetical protein